MGRGEFLELHGTRINEIFPLKECAFLRCTKRIEMPKVRIDLEACDGCGVCVSVCPAFVLELLDGKARAVNPEACLGIRAKQLCSECIETQEICTGCVACVRSCPTAAIEILET